MYVTRDVQHILLLAEIYYRWRVIRVVLRPNLRLKTERLEVPADREDTLGERRTQRLEQAGSTLR